MSESNCHQSFHTAIANWVSVLMSASMYGLTLTSGYIYLKALCALSEKKQDINIGNISDAVNDVMKDKSEVKEFMNEAKKSYK